MARVPCSIPVFVHQTTMPSFQGHVRLTFGICFSTSAVLKCNKPNILQTNNGLSIIYIFVFMFKSIMTDDVKKNKKNIDLLQQLTKIYFHIAHLLIFLYLCETSSIERRNERMMSEAMATHCLTNGMILN
jgi:UDP-N-acetylmuramyl pentapeptide phosphotransferase/UDP-N-acetylglucosamine-1-phosphate transferase